MNEIQAMAVYKALHNNRKYVTKICQQLHEKGLKKEANDVAEIIQSIIDTQNKVSQYIPGAGQIGPVGVYL